MADTYKMIAGILIFVVFISVTLTMAAQTFPDLAPGGVNPVSVLPQESQPVITPVQNCTSGNWGCAVSQFLGNVANGLIAGGAMLAGIFGMLLALLSFQIPALQQDPLLQLLNVLIDIVIFVPLALFGFRLLKGFVPTVGGDVD